MIALLAVAVVGFGNVKQLFFPDSSMPKFMIDVWTPEGTRIQDVAADIRKAEEMLLADDRVSGVATFVGSGPPSSPATASASGRTTTDCRTSRC